MKKLFQLHSPFRLYERGREASIRKFGVEYQKIRKSNLQACILIDGGDQDSSAPLTDCEEVKGNEEDIVSALIYLVGKSSR